MGVDLAERLIELKHEFVVTFFTFFNNKNQKEYPAKIMVLTRSDPVKQLMKELGLHFSKSDRKYSPEVSKFVNTEVHTKVTHDKNTTCTIRINPKILGGPS